MTQFGTNLIMQCSYFFRQQSENSGRVTSAFEVVEAVLFLAEEQIVIAVVAASFPSVNQRLTTRGIIIAHKFYIQKNMSKVVLVCVKQKVTHDQLHQVFSRFGSIQKILIFEKSNIYKIFIEYENAFQANQSLSLNKSNQLKIQVFMSSLEALNFAESNPDGKIYAPNNESTDDDEHSIKASQQNYQLHYKNHILQQLALLKHFNSNSKYTKQLEQCLQLQAQLLEKYVLEQTPPKSRIVQAGPFDENYFNIRMLYNLFSIYGNIEKMLFQKDTRTLLVQYALQKCADQAVEKLDKVRFFNELFVTYSTEQEIEFSNEMAEELLYFFEERFQGSEEFNRYKPKNSYVAAAPNDTVFIMNLADENSAQYLLKLAPALNYQFYADPKEKHSCAIRFNTTEEAIHFVCRYHGIQLGGRKILITFSKKPM